MLSIYKMVTKQCYKTVYGMQISVSGDLVGEVAIPMGTIYVQIMESFDIFIRLGNSCYLLIKRCFGNSQLDNK